MKKHFYFIIVLLFFTGPILAQNSDLTNVINIGKDFTSDAVVYPFNSDTLYGIGINGNVVLNSDTSIVRVILVDTMSLKEYLVFESYPMLDTGMSLTFSSECDETCFLDGFIANAIKIQVKDATIRIDMLKWSNTFRSNLSQLQVQAKKDKEANKISKLNAYITKNGMIWKAGTTNLSKLSYTDKKKIWGDKYQNYGYEYYVGGIFEIKDAQATSRSFSYDEIENFDWRNRHDANQPSSLYYDGDIYGSGWMTPPRCQVGCWLNNTFVCDMECEECLESGGEWRDAGTCWAFGPVAQTEAVTNLYFNQHFDIDLSEQDVVSCSGGGSTHGGSPSIALNYIKSTGVVNEACFPYTGLDDNCSGKCTSPQERISFANVSSIPRTESDIKNALINNGPITVGSIYFIWGYLGHALLLVGYDIVEEGDIIDGLESPIPFGSPYIGQTYWILKNSYGLSLGDNGYSYWFFSQLPWLDYKVTTPISSLNLSEANRLCADKDGDGYYNWGIGAKPSNCPNCPAEKDGNDNNLSLGPIDENGFCSIIGDYNTSFEEHFDEWKQVNTDDLDWVKHSGETPTPGTGPAQAQDGQYYIYIEASDYAIPNKTGVLESPLISCPNACYIDFSFWFHKQTTNWGWENSKLELQTSTDGGQTWTPNVWEKVGEANGSPDWQNVDLQINPTVNKIRFIAETGLNWYNDIALDNISIHPVKPSEITTSITSNESWSNEVSVCGNIEIEPSATLTLLPKCNVIMNNGCKIIVKRGAKLVIDNAKITSKTNNPWRGIELWGNSNLSQLPNTNQGVVELINGGTIENAVTGIKTFRPDPNDEDGYLTDYTGGIVHATGGVFKNNKVAVEYLPYGYNSSSYFTECNFVTDAALTGGNTPDYFVKLNGIKGIKFSGCTFSNTRADDVCTSYERGNGIMGNNASFAVTYYCTGNSVPCSTSETVPSSFSKLYYGVYATGQGAGSIVSLKSSEYNCKAGVYLSGTTGAEVLSNDFNTTMTAGTGIVLYPYGLYLNNSTGYHVEDNDFYGTVTGSSNLGIIVNNSGTADNSIYNNRFNLLNRGIQSQGINRGGTSTGLCITCNDFTNCTYDINVQGTVSTNGIACYQGTASSPAGNTFSAGATYSIYSGPSSLIYYHHAAVPQWKLIPNPVYNVSKSPTLVHYSKIGSCPSLINNGSSTDNLSLMNAAESSAATTQSQLTTLVDAGNTATLTTDVATSTPPEAIETRDELLTASPYLSDTVMKTAVGKEDVLTNAMIRDVLVANPQSAKSDQVLEAVDNRVNPMPDYMMDQIMEGQNTTGAKENLEAQLSVWQHERNRAFFNLYRNYASPEAGDSLMLLLDGEPSIEARYMKAEALVAKGEIGNAITVLNAIPSDFTLNDAQQSEYNAWIDYAGILQTIATRGGNTLWPDSTETTNLMVLAQNDNLVAGAYARDLLIAAGKLAYEEPILNDDGLKTEITRKEHKGLSATEKTLNLFPNPAKHYVTIAYSLEEEPANATIMMTDATGRMVKQLQISAKKDQVILPLSDMQPGTYIIQLLRNNKVIASEKLSIAQ
jgi:hypothetical protein